MDFSDTFKLEKLTIQAVEIKEGKKNSLTGDAFQVMFNPQSVAQRIANKLIKTPSINENSADETQFAGAEPEILDLLLTLDGTGVKDYAAALGLGGASKTVTEQISEFKKLCYDVDGEKHEPNVVNVRWNKVIDANYRLGSVDIVYKSFARNGEPLRAELKISFLKYSSVVNASSAMSSPDVSHIHRVKTGDTLPLLANKIYGSPKYYLLIAAANNLDNFRSLEPGTQLSFPPLRSK